MDGLILPVILIPLVYLIYYWLFPDCNIQGQVTGELSNKRSKHNSLTPGNHPGKEAADKWWIWPVIILVLLLLTILAWKLTTDMKRTRDDKAESI